MSNQKNSHLLNKMLLNLETYASKAISLEAKKDPAIVDLSFGEPEFGPPDYILKSIVENELTLDAFLDSVKRYENPRGSLELRKAISEWYKERYDLEVNPEKEILVTHGGVEAINLAILCTSEVGDKISITDPSYMLYKRTILTLGRMPNSLSRSENLHEYEDMFKEKNAIKSGLSQSKAIIINSPENPSGYVLDKNEWELIEDYSNKTGLWVIHDEVYDTMTFDRNHIPCRKMPLLANNSILINSFSKKFGIPGLRIGWMVANEELINIASKAHDYMYLGVNILCEKIATRILSSSNNAQWLASITNNLHERATRAVAELGEKEGFSWIRKPYGAMFLFPNVRRLYDLMLKSYKLESVPVGDAVAKYLLKEKKVAVVPGSVYGPESQDHIRLVLCPTENEFTLALERLKS